MAGHLLAADLPVTVWNRTAEKAIPLAEKGAEIAQSLAEVAEECKTILLCVNRTEDVDEVLTALLAAAKPGTLIIDHSTIAPLAAKEFHARCTAHSIRFVDAPVTGGSTGAQAGKLVIFLGGEDDDCVDAKETVAPYAKRVERVGGPGAGQSMKMANQIAVGGALLGLCESLALAARSGLDVRQARDMIGSGAGGSWAFEFYGPRMLDENWEPGFSVKNQRKDFGYVEEAARALGMPIPGTEACDAWLAKLEAKGQGEDATYRLYELLRDGDAP